MTPEQQSIEELAEVCKEIIRILHLFELQSHLRDRLDAAYKKCIDAKDRVNL